MEIKLYNSLTKKIEIFKPIKENEISMYVCGPTVYNHIHIGNARPVIFFDTVRRFFEHIGYKVNYVSNFTDIDDKIIKKAKEENVDELIISNRYIDEYLKVTKALNCKDTTASPRVTECMDDIIKFINELVEKGYAYTNGDDTYFRVSKVSDYGILSGQRLDELTVGARINVDSLKENPVDFTLWKKTSDDGIKWESSLGDGRPGWHTECVVMIDKLFGGMIDIHGGGNDLKFPHHENEIAQSMALHNHHIANYWLHNGRVDLNGEKMSKSVGNVIWMKDLVEKYSFNVYRLMILSSQYRQTMNFSYELMDSFKKEYDKLSRAYISLYRKLELDNALELTNEVNKDYLDKFILEIANDFNTANAITIMYELVKQINKDVRANAETFVLVKHLNTLVEMFNVLGLNIEIKKLSQEEFAIVTKWLEARKNKDFASADILRAQIIDMGIVL